MSEIEQFKSLLEQIDTLLESYAEEDLSLDRIVKDIFNERAKKRPILEKVIQLATEGLEKYPYNTELLRRRSWARSQIITPDVDYPDLELAEQDLRTILAFDPNNLYAAFDLLESLFTHSAMEDSAVAEVAHEFATMSERLLLQNRALQIRALIDADERAKAQEIYDNWINRFPDSDILKAAIQYGSI